MFLNDLKKLLTFKGHEELIIFIELINFRTNPHNLLVSRTTTLNDIYRNLGLNGKNDEERKLQRKQDQFIDDAEEYKEEYEEGDVTGFMSQKPLTNSGINTFNVSSRFFLYSFF